MFVAEWNFHCYATFIIVCQLLSFSFSLSFCSNTYFDHFMPSTHVATHSTFIWCYNVYKSTCISALGSIWEASVFNFHRTLDEGFLYPLFFLLENRFFCSFFFSQNYGFTLLWEAVDILLNGNQKETRKCLFIGTVKKISFFLSSWKSGLNKNVKQISVIILNNYS